jgi:alcohol dehydrogenase (cytochrome c)
LSPIRPLEIPLPGRQSGGWRVVAAGEGQEGVRPLIFHGTGNPGPWNPNQRPGDNKWTAGIFARDADTGEARWFYQWNPHDVHDWDGINENVLVDLDWKGQPRKALVHPDRNSLV